MTAAGAAGDSLAAPYGGSARRLVAGRLRGYREWPINWKPENRFVLRLPSFTTDMSVVDTTPPQIEVAYRPVLKARAWNYEWVPGAQKATCNVPETGITLYNLTTGGIVGSMKRHPEGKPVPASECACGFYAVHDPFVNRGEISYHLQTFCFCRGMQREDAVVCGAIEAWGDVEIGSNGFRAENARLLALALKPTTAWWAGLSAPSCPSGLPRSVRECREALKASLTKMYGVPVFENMEDLVRVYPPIPVGNLLDEEGAEGLAG